MKYTRLIQGNSFRTAKVQLVPTDANIYDYVTDRNQAYYRSIYEYSDEHYKIFKTTGSVAGITDVTTNTLVFDFDNEKDIEKAKNDAATLATRLIQNNIPEDCIAAYYSGKKGFHIHVAVDKSLTPAEFKSIVFALAGDLSSFDTKIHDPNRVIRLEGTKHNETSFYKFPLTIGQLCELPVHQIQSLAMDLDNIDPRIEDGFCVAELPDAIYKLREKTPVSSAPVELEENELDMSAKPKWLSDAKYALQNGYFLEGERNEALLILATTYKNQGFPKDVVYRMLKGVATLQAQRYGTERYPEVKIWKEVVAPVFNPTWKGGTFAYETTPLLQQVTKRLDLKEPKSDDIFLTMEQMHDRYTDFAKNIEKNTMRLGIPEIDDKVRITTSMFVGLLGSPSSGKTSIVMDVLHHASKTGIPSVFFSMDMGENQVYQRLLQKHTGLSRKVVEEAFKSGSPVVKEYLSTLKASYSSVGVSYKTGLDVDTIREAVIKRSEQIGEPVKLVVVDYLECVTGPYSDPTANTAMVAHKLKDMANDLHCTVFVLLQPQKHAGDPSCELTSYRSIKGSSVIEQAASVVLTIWRPGFSPKHPEEDKYASIAVVKNRMGSLCSFDFGWDGTRGTVYSLTDEERHELKELRDRRAKEAAFKDL